MTYGYRRIHQDLRAHQIQAGKNRIYRLMKEHGIHAKTKKQFKVTTDSKHNHVVYENVLNRDFIAHQADLRWVSDITYIPNFKIPIERHLLKRIKHTKPQSELSFTDRQSNLINAFQCKKPIPDIDFVLFDDVMTTGNTINAACQALSQAGVQYTPVMH